MIHAYIFIFPTLHLLLLFFEIPHFSILFYLTLREKLTRFSSSRPAEDDHSNFVDVCHEGTVTYAHIILYLFVFLFRILVFKISNFQLPLSVYHFQRWTKSMIIILNLQPREEKRTFEVGALYKIVVIE